MMGPEYFTVAAYFDGECGCTIICRACGEKKRRPASDQLTENMVWESWGTDECGLYCDDCGEEIVEPYAEEPEEDEPEEEE